MYRKEKFYFCNAMPNNELFAEFPPVSKADWLRQIARDLKDRPLEDFEWTIADGVRVSPFVHAEDFETPPTPLWASSKGWEIFEIISVEDAATANAQAMEALNGGAEGLQFNFNSPPDWSDLEQTFSGRARRFEALYFLRCGDRWQTYAIFH